MRNRLLIIFSILCLVSYATTSLSKDEAHDHAGEEKHDDHKAEAHDEHADHDEHKEEEKEHSEDEHGDEHAHGDEHSNEDKDEHGHEKETKSAGHGDHDDHGEEEEEQSSSIGPEKGITEKSENGFKLSAEAIKTMEIQMKPVGSSSISIDKNTLVLVKDEKTVFRVREGWIKRVPVKVLAKSNGIYSISSDSLKSEDQIIVHGTGFLRIAEVFATEGASHGHSH